MGVRVPGSLWEFLGVSGSLWESLGVSRSLRVSVNLYKSLRHNNATKQHFSAAPPFTKMSMAPTRPPLLHLFECQVNGTFKTCFDMLIARSPPRPIPLPHMLISTAVNSI